METEAFKKAYVSLNEAQKKAVDAIDGPVIVVAGPGTGKTTILTLRIARILMETDTRPENILALTFTNSGVRAMRKKLITFIGDAAYRVGIFTFHSFAEHILKEFPFYFPEMEYAKVISDLEKVMMLEEILDKDTYTELVSKHDRYNSLREVRSAIDSIKQEGLNPEEFRALIPEWEKELYADERIYYQRKFKNFKQGDLKPAEEAKIKKKLAKAAEIADVFTEYQTFLFERGRYDFSDMIIRVLAELETNENLKLELQERYQYLLVDEHQDTNAGQNRLIELLTDAEHLDGRPNVFTVGDEKQSIYRFQGASAETFAYFTSQYRDVETITLTDNYRSTKNILEAAHGLITHSMPDATELSPSRSEDLPVTVGEFSNYKYELLFLAEDIKQNLAEGVSPEEIAIIYRSNRHIHDIKTALEQAGIAYSVMSKDRVLEDRTVWNLITLLRVVENPADDASLGRALFIDFLKLDPLRSVDVLRNFARARRESNQSLISVLETEAAYEPFISMVKALTIRKENTPFEQFFKEFLHDSGYLDHMLAAPDSRDQLIKIDTLIDEIKRQTAEAKTYRLADFLRFVDAVNTYGLDIETSKAAITGGVVCMTAHGSKGLEFEHVYVVDATRSSWEKKKPNRRIALPIKDYQDGDLDEERRLFYVAMTRAKRTLTITSSLSNWEGKERERSQFVTEVAAAKDVSHIEATAFETGHVQALTAFLSPPLGSASVFDQAYLARLFRESNLSVTALNNYLDCPIKYLFRSLIQLPSEYTPVLAFGNAVHAALEAFFNVVKVEKSIPARETLLELFDREMKRSFPYEKEYARYHARGVETLTAYYDASLKNAHTDIATELYIRRDLALPDGSTIQLSGKIDKVEYLEGEGGGRIRVIDYKTGKPFSEKSKKSQKEDLERQIVYYHLLLLGYMEGKYTVAEAILDFVEPNKNGEFEQHSIHVTEDDIEAIVQSVSVMAANVTSGAFLTMGCGKKECKYCALKTRVEARA